MLEIIAVLAIGALYFAPTIVAFASPPHKNAGFIAVVNLFFGWTLIGWVVSAVWACNSNNVQPLVSQPARVPCPECAELILPEAKVCKHCGYRLAPEGGV